MKVSKTENRFSTTENRFAKKNDFNISSLDPFVGTVSGV